MGLGAKNSTSFATLRNSVFLFGINALRRLSRTRDKRVSLRDTM